MEGRTFYMKMQAASIALQMNESEGGRKCGKGGSVRRVVMNDLLIIVMKVSLNFKERY